MGTAITFAGETTAFVLRKTEKMANQHQTFHCSKNKVAITCVKIRSTFRSIFRFIVGKSAKYRDFDHAPK